MANIWVLMPTFIVKTLGCKVNQYEGAAAAQTLRQAGLTDCGDAQPPDLCVIHTCCVTARAAAKTRQLIRRLAAQYPQAVLTVTGCYASADAGRLRRIPGVRSVAGHQDDLRGHLTQLASELLHRKADLAGSPQGRTHAGRNDATAVSTSRATTGISTNSYPSDSTPNRADSFNSVKDIRTPAQGDSPAQNGRGAEPLAALNRFDGRCRAMLKVQDGCDAMCSYCIVPHLRRRIYSRPAEAVKSELRRLIASGHREVVLCGVCLGAYGRATTRPGCDGDDHLPGLLAELAPLAAPARLRLSSLHPAEVTARLLEVMAGHDNICHHLHLSLQSGSAAVLERMNRRYTPEQYLQAVDRAKRHLDAPAITTDAIVGFPGETEADFEATLAVVRAVGFARVHVFPFSPREGTPAAQWADQRPATDVVRQRCEALKTLAGQLAARYRARFVGRTVRVLCESPDAGLSDRYLRVTFEPAGAEPIGRIVSVRIEAATAISLTGRIV